MPNERILLHTGTTLTHQYHTRDLSDGNKERIEAHIRALWPDSAEKILNALYNPYTALRVTAEVEVTTNIKIKIDGVVDSRRRSNSEVSAS